MKRLLISGSIMAVVAALVLGACSDLKKDLLSPILGGPKVHPSSWADSTSPNFHGRVVLASPDSAKVLAELKTCAKCHASTYGGGTSGVSCFKCHSDYPHMVGWADSASATFHGGFLKSGGYKLQPCAKCHGGNYTGGSTGVSCYKCHSSYPHTSAWIDSTSTNFHGKVLQAGQDSLKNCTACHGGGFSGGSSGVSCFGCHASYPHLQGWADSTSATFHGAYLQGNGFNLQSCATCHGSDYKGGTAQVNCYGCHDSYPHNTSWTVGGSPSSHGVYLKNTTPTAWNSQKCATCHGTTYAGGNTGVSCFTCHAAYPHDVAFGGGYHPAYMYAKGFPLKQCQVCHGTSYTGGSVLTVSCEQSGCHVDANGTPKSPEACNTCHGVFSAPATTDPTTWAPPRDLNGNTPTTLPGVGAHQTHFKPIVSNAVQCQECHTVPSSVFDAGHIGSQPYAAALNWGSLAALSSANGTYTPNPSYDRTAHTCSNTFCHGAWRLKWSTSTYQYIYNASDTVMGGENFAPNWTGGSSQAQCGSCHGLPPRGHIPFAITACYSCHDEVIDRTGKIIDQTKHINGKVNVFGSEYPF